MGLFGKSFEEKVEEAVGALKAKNLVDRLGAKVDGKVVTLMGVAKSLDAKTRAMQAFNDLVETENTINQIRVEEPAPAPKAVAPAPAPAAAPTPAATEPRVHVVAKGDTLSHIAKSYYGSAHLYMKIFNANKDILDDPDKIQVGQKLRIPE